MKVIITKAGEELKSTTWIEGQEIDCHENLAKDFIERGFAIDPNNIVEVKETKTPKTKKK